MPIHIILVCFIASGALLAQDPTNPIDVQSLRQAVAQDVRPSGLAVDSTPHTSLMVKPDVAADEAKRVELEKMERAVAEAKRRENAPRRFGADLFETRQTSLAATTEGGVSDEYVLGTGDLLQLNVFGSATFDVPLSVDGKGEVIIPKIGTVKVTGLSLGKARQAIQSRVAEQFSRSSAALSVIKLREVRVFVIGEVYKPGSFLVPSLSSLVNVLSLSGGPTLLGSFRDVRLLRGGRLVHSLDLYPLRAEGRGNMNLYLQNGDIIFIPLAQTQVLLEGGFTRVLPSGQAFLDGPEAREARGEVDARPQSPAGRGPVNTKGSWISKDPIPEKNPTTAKDLNSGKEFQADGQSKRDIDPSDVKEPVIPTPSKGMLFELLPGETASEALAFAGGLAPSSHTGILSLRRIDSQGLTSVLDLPVNDLSRVPLQKGDVLTALPRRDRAARVVTLTGWVRVPGVFARPEGLRVGALLRRDNQVLPDTYLQRGEILRTLEDGTTRQLRFHVEKALAGDPAHDLILADRDQVELFPLQRLRLPKTVTLNGPFTEAGTFDFHDGMRLGDLVFKAGVPEKRANTLAVELARSKYGKPSQVRTFDLARLLSTEAYSPLDVEDEAQNPLLQEDDVITVYEKPEFRLHRTVRITGQVAKPGTYVLDQDHATLSQLIQRAGGLTQEAMPRAGIFLRSLANTTNAGVREEDTQLGGVAEILERLNETKMVELKVDPSKTGGAPMVFKPPVLHGLGAARLNRMVVDFGGILVGRVGADVELQHGDEIIIPRKTDAAMILGETSTPFAFYHLNGKTTVGDLLRLAGGVTRNADKANIRLLKADGRIVDSWVSWREVEPGDAVLVPQRIRYESRWQENIQALTPLALLLNALR